jgi:hypothetical protein
VKLYLGCSSFRTWTYKYHHIPQMFYKDNKYFLKIKTFPIEICVYFLQQF